MAKAKIFWGVALVFVTTALVVGVMYQVFHLNGVTEEKTSPTTMIVKLKNDLTDTASKLADVTKLIAEAQRNYAALKDLVPGFVLAAPVVKSGIKPSELSKNYEVGGPYMGAGAARYQDGPRLKLDVEGFPMVKYGDSFHYNPVTMAQFALAEYSRPDGTSEKFLPAVERLLKMQGPDGAFRYDFPFPKYASGEIYEPGWISGMAQGQAISVFARAYITTRDDKYRAAAKKALDFMFLDESRGGPLTTLKRFPPEPSDLPFIMEYPQNPPVYTLNGYMFSLLGLYDWISISNDSDARIKADNLMSALKVLLPYYDLGAFTAYDLSFITIPQRKGKRARPHIGPGYHKVHIELLWALHNITGDPELKEVADRWLSYVSLGPAPAQ